MSKESYPEFRKPEQWKNGAGGYACISYKGIPGLTFGKDDPRTMTLNNLKVGETFIFDKDGSSFTRTREDVWTITSVESGKKYVKDVFTGSSALHYSECFRKALKNSYYDDDLIIIMTCFGLGHRNDGKREDGKVMLFLEESKYNQVKTYYEAYNTLEECECKCFFIKFTDNWENMRKIHFSNRISWQHRAFKGESNQYLNPKTITFAGRCQCDECSKNPFFKNADKIKAAEIADIDLIVEHVNSTIETSNEKFIISVPRRYSKYVKDKIKSKVCDGNPTGEYHKFVEDNDDVRIILDVENSYPYQNIPNFYDLSIRPYTFFMLNRPSASSWEHWSGMKEYMEESVQKSKIDEKRRQELCKRVQYAFIQEGKVVLEVAKRY